MKNNFNLMRLLFAASVVVSHAFGMLGLPEPSVWGLSAGGAAVHGFFVISGYLITQSYARSVSTVTFSLNRVLRIVPGLLCALGFARVLWIILDRYDPLLHNGPLWTLAWEAACYVAVAAAGMLGVLTKRNAGLFIFVAWVLYLSNSASDTETFRIVVPMFMLFMMGGSIALFEDQIQFSSAAAIAIPILVVLFCPRLFDPALTAFRYLSFYHSAPLTDWQMHEIPYLLAFPFFIIYVGKYLPALVAPKSDLSYGIYIYGWPVEVAVGYLAHKHNLPLLTHLWGYVPVVLVITVGMALMSWHIIEKPALLLKRRVPAIRSAVTADDGSGQETAGAN
ncbi:acyltransferase family protein [Burkholderia vietnamiensis]|uniref:acyltransferase family protein n=1 Tax=Burkholderia vietnamiensis TaxID=60552 RepID=UPI00158DA85E|nr:acyltransferase [Burkholderia vietnamiensis]